jgi:hypothetical protein
MQKNQNTKLLTAFSLLFVLAMSPLALASAQTSNTVSTDASGSANVTASGSSSTGSLTEDSKKDKVKDRLEKIRAEIAEKAKKRLEEKRDLRHPERDFRPTIAFSGETGGWTVIDGKAYKSTITLRDGKAAKVGEHQWRVAVNGTISIEDKSFDVHLKGKVQGKRHGGATVLLHGTIMNEQEHKIALGGYVAPTNVDNTFALAFTKAGFKGERYDFFQVGHVTTSPFTTADVSSQQSLDAMASFRATISVE